MGKEIHYNSEAKVKATVKKLLNKHGWYWWMPPANGFGKSGASDFHALRKGAFLAIETKFGANKATALQIAHLQSIVAEHGMGMIVNEKNIDWFARWLELFDKAGELFMTKEKLSEEEGSEFLNAYKALTDPIADKGEGV